MMRDRLAIGRRAAPALLLVVLAAAWLVPGLPGLDLAPIESNAVVDWDATLDDLPPTPIVLVAFDADLGTYAEIRPTVRAALGDLLAREARLAFVSLTPEGRALALGELDRLEEGGANPQRRIDLGFTPGAEAGIVELSRRLPVPEGAEGAIARRLSEEGSAAIDALFVVGGNEIGPRSWIEQYLPRIGPRPVVAVAPTVLLPELLPYAESGQIGGLIATPGDGAAYRETAWVGNLERFADPAPPKPLPVATGLLVALGLLAWALLGPGWTHVRSRGRGEVA
jgi:hypothetical protein